MSRRERKLLRRRGAKQKDTSVHTEEHHEAKEEIRTEKKKRNKFVEFYDNNYKRNMWVTIVLLIISIIIIAGTAFTTGDVIHRGISLKGGVTVTVPYEGVVNIEELQQNLQNKLGGSINIRALSKTGTTIGFIIDASDVDADDLVAATEAELGELPKISVETMGSALGESFFQQTLLAILIAFVLMAIVVFIAFKTLIPGLAVILSAFSDMVMTIAVLNLFHIKIETAGIAALLMLIGYSVDTDILLTTRVIKRNVGTVFDRVMSAMKTGMTMTVTSFVAIFVGYFFTQSETLKQIMMILLIGLAFDIPNTWIQNVGILRWYMEKKSKKEAHETMLGYTQPAHHENKPARKEHHKPVEHKPVEHKHQDHKHHTTEHHEKKD